MIQLIENINRKRENPMTIEKQELKSIHLKVGEGLLSEIDQFTKDYHFTNRTDAMRYLLASGLKWQNAVEDILQEKKGNNKEK